MGVNGCVCVCVLLCLGVCNWVLIVSLSFSVLLVCVYVSWCVIVCFIVLFLCVIGCVCVLYCYSVCFCVLVCLSRCLGVNGYVCLVCAFIRLCVPECVFVGVSVLLYFLDAGILNTAWLVVFPVMSSDRGAWPLSTKKAARAHKHVPQQLLNAQSPAHALSHLLFHMGLKVKRS